MHGDDDDIQLRQHRVVQIQRPIVEDVNLGALQNRDAGEPLLEAVDGFELSVKLAPRQATCDAYGFRVVGDGDVLVSALACRLDHVREIVCAVGRVGVDLEVSADVRELEQPWQLAFPGRLNLASRLAQLRRNPGQADGVEDLLLGTAADAARAAEDPVFVDLEPAFDAARCEWQCCAPSSR